MKIKKEYLNKRITENGIDYDFRSLSPEKLEKIHANNPSLRKYFEEELTDEEKAFIRNIEEREFFEGTIDAELKEIGIDTPKKFDETIKKVAATRAPRKKK